MGEVTVSIYAGTMSILLTLEPLADTDNSNVHHQENKKGETTKAFRLQRSGHGVL